MAITHRLYRTERIPNGRGGYRAAISPYITEDPYIRDAQGNPLLGPDGKELLKPEDERSTFHHWQLVPEFRAFYCYAWATPAEHALCAADPLVTPLTDEHPTRASLEASLAGTLAGDFGMMTNVLEGDGIAPDDLNGSSTFGDLLRIVARHHYVTQSMWSGGHKPATLVMQKTIGLGHRRNQVPEFVRSLRAARLAGSMAVSDIATMAELDWIEANASADLWCDQHGVSRSGMSPNAPIRELRRRAVRDAQLDANRFAMKLHKLTI